MILAWASPFNYIIRYTEYEMYYISLLQCGCLTLAR